MAGELALFVLCSRSLPAHLTKWTIYSFSPAYDDGEPEYDPEEPVEPFDPDVETNGQIDDIAVGQNPDQLLTTGDRGVVVSGDPAAAANRGKGGDKAPKDKKIPHDQRTTTPYMTKYERARILGTRALQIRLVFIGRAMKDEVGRNLLTAEPPA